MIIGHQRQLEFLQTIKDSGRLGHAYILAGPARVGKKTAALEWLSQIFGLKLGDATAHPDFLFMEPLVDAKTGKRAGEITVAQIRNLIWKLSLKPASAPIKAAVINDAHLMNTESQNCLLKTLEEPPGDAIIILVAQNANRLLETIRSRCQILQFNFVSVKEMGDYAASLQNLDQRQKMEMVKLSFGRPGRLIEFAADPERLKEWQARMAEFARMINSDLPERFAYAAKIAETENFDEELEAWQAHYRDLLLEALTPRKEEGKEEEASGAAGSSQFVFTKLKQKAIKTPQEIAAILEKIHNLGLVLQTTNASPRLALENFMLDL